MKKLTIFLIFNFSLLIINCANAQNEITLDGVKISLNKIPIDGRPFRYYESLLKFHPNLYKSFKISDTIINDIFSSINKNYFIVTKYIFSGEKYNDDTDTIFDYCDKNGNKIWTKTYTGKPATRCYISDQGNFVSIHFNYTNEITSLWDFVTFNNKGNILFRDTNAIEIICNYNKDAFLYTKSEFGHGANNLFILDLKDNEFKSREINFNDSIINVSVSGLGDNFLCLSKNNLYSLNIKGQLLWKKDIQKYPGFYYLSNDGNYYSRILDSGKFELWDNKTNQLILSKCKEKIDGVSFEPVEACFVKGDDNAIAISDATLKGIMVVLFKLTGERIGYKIFEKARSYHCFVEFDIENGYNIYIDGIYAGTIKKNN